jgi:hypothetical protein
MMIPKQTFLHTTGTFLVALSFLLPLSSITKADSHGSKGEGEACIECHRSEQPGIYKEWNDSKHGQYGVDCYDCHKAETDDVDAFKHNGKTISVLVTPNDCQRCHEQEVKESNRSHHAKGGDILASADNILGAVVGGPAAVVVGCEQCHGSKVEIGADGKPSAGWPNTGIGRLNPDGSKGACTSCHTRHAFSKAQARQPEACGKCHLGPDHPQLEVYNESQHGIVFRAKIDEMNLESQKWVAGIDYSAAPTCATCHMSAAPGAPKTHDVGERLSWNLRAKISSKKNMVRLNDGLIEYDVAEGQALPKVGDKPEDPKAGGGTVSEVLTWEDRRNKMQTVCQACHSPAYVNSHYESLDKFVALYNDKFAKPVSAIMGELSANGTITKTAFDDWIEWLWWELWHHEGRRARTGAAMMGPDYAWWHGIYDVAKRLYMEFIPELNKIAGEEESKRLQETHLKPIEGHDWYFEALGDATSRASVLDGLEIKAVGGDNYNFKGGISINDEAHIHNARANVGDATEVRVKITENSTVVDNSKIKVFVVINGEERLLNGVNGQGQTWELDKNGEVVVWNAPVPEKIVWDEDIALQGQKVSFVLEINEIRSEALSVNIN